MKKLTLTLVALLLWTSSLEAQIMLKTDKELEVGSNVVGVFGYDPPEAEDYPILNDTISIFCAGVDVNNNGIIDPEDEPASWWKYNTKDTSSSAYKVLDFEYFFKRPYHFAFNSTWGFKVSATFLGYNEDDKKASYTFGKNIDLKNNDLQFPSAFSTTNLLYYYKRFEYEAYIIEGDIADSIIAISRPTLKMELKGKFVGISSKFSYRKNPNYGFLESWIVYSVLSVENGELWLEQFKDESSVSDTAEKVFEQNLLKFNPETDTITSLTNDIQMTIKSSDTNQVKYRFHYRLPENEKLLPYEDETPTYVAKLEGATNAIVTNDRNIIIKNLYAGKGERSDIEMHRSEFEIGYMTKQMDYVFVASKHKNEKHIGKIAIYDYKNKTVAMNYSSDWDFENWHYVGYQPVATYVDPYLIHSKDSLELHTLCMGVDYNFNGEIDVDMGDVAPSLWRSSVRIGSYFKPFEKIMDIDFKINLPVKANLSPEGNILIPSWNNLMIYSRKENKIIDTLKLGMYIVSVDAVEFNSHTYYLLGLRDYDSGKSYARVISKTADYDQSYETKYTITDAKFTSEYNFGEVVAISERKTEQELTQIEFVSFGSKIVALDKSDLLFGSGGRISMPILSDLIYIVLSNSHIIYVYRPESKEYLTRIETLTKGSGGPRDVGYDKSHGLLYVSTFSGEIQMYDSYNGGPYRRFNKKGTGFTNDINTTIYDNLFIDNIQHTYNDPSNRVYLFNSFLTDVDYDFSKITTPPIRIYPHPIGNEFHMVSDELVGELEIAIIDGQGKIVATHSTSANGEVAMSADELGLGAGNYTAIINGTKAVRFIVIK